MQGVKEGTLPDVSAARQGAYTVLPTAPTSASRPVQGKALRPPPPPPTHGAPPISAATPPGPAHVANPNKAPQLPPTVAAAAAAAALFGPGMGGGSNAGSVGHAGSGHSERGIGSSTVLPPPELSHRTLGVFQGAPLHGAQEGGLEGFWGGPSGGDENEEANRELARIRRIHQSWQGLIAAPKAQRFSLEGEWARCASTTVNRSRLAPPL